MDIDLLGGSSEAKYKSLNSQRTINWYLTLSTPSEADKVQKSLHPTPGNTLYATAAGRYHRGAFVAQGINIDDRCFFVTDQTLYELGSSGNIITIGSISNIPYGTTEVSFQTSGNNHVFIGQAGAGYDLTLSTNTLTAISDTDFPGAEDSDYMDGYLFVIKNGRAYFNAVLNDFTNWDGLDVITPSFKADSVKAVGCLKTEVTFFGSQTIETYLNDGATPFIRRSGSTVLYGIAAVKSKVTFDSGHIFVGKNDKGQYAVYLYGIDYSIQPISDFNRTWQLNNKVKSIGNAHAFVQYTKDGHVLYNLTIPELHTTWVYDVITREWTERQSRQPYDDLDGENVYREFIGRFYVNFMGKNIFFDRYSGKIFLEDYSVQTENGNIIKRVRTSQSYDQSRQYVSVSSLEIDANRGEAATNTSQGSSPIIMLEISKDGGYTFGNPRHIDMGKLGQYIKRLKINKLGTARCWVLRLSLTDPVDLIIQKAIATGTLSTG